MAESLYTKKEHAQFRGPTTSDHYNERVENLYKDLVHLYNKVGLSEEGIRLASQRILKDLFSLSHTLEDLEDRVLSLEADQNRITFRTDTSFDTTRFDESPYEIQMVDRLYQDDAYGLVTLPKVISSSASKIYFVNSDGEAMLPNTFEAMSVGDTGTADNGSALVDATDLYAAFLPDSDIAWERNVIVTNPDVDGAVVKVYAKLPLDLMLNADSNAILINTFPIMGCEIVEIAYSTQNDISLSDSDNYVALNSASIYSGISPAVGWLPPGGWDDDEILDAGPKAFYFDPKQITAVRITLRQRSFYAENGKYVYSYGMSKFDVRYEKFLDSGKAIFRFDAPQGETISTVTNVLPQIWNVSEAELPDIFDYRVLWETSYNSGEFITTPVAFSNRVWVEVTLNKTLNGGSPALSGLVVSYT